MRAVARVEDLDLLRDAAVLLGSKVAAGLRLKSQFEALEALVHNTDRKKRCTKSLRYAYTAWHAAVRVKQTGLEHTFVTASWK